MRNTHIVWAFVALWSGAVLIPVGLLVLWSFLKMEDYGFVWTLTTEAYRHIIDYGRYRVGLETHGRSPPLFRSAGELYSKHMKLEAVRYDPADCRMPWNGSNRRW